MLLVYFELWNVFTWASSQEKKMSSVTVRISSGFIGWSYILSNDNHLPVGLLILGTLLHVTTVFAQTLCSGKQVLARATGFRKQGMNYVNQTISEWSGSGSTEQNNPFTLYSRDNVDYRIIPQTLPQKKRNTEVGSLLWIRRLLVLVFAVVNMKAWAYHRAEELLSLLPVKSHITSS